MTRPCQMTAFMAAAAASIAVAGAQAPLPPDAIADTVQPAAAPAMWRVSDADSEFTLFGTFHFLKPDAVWRTEALERAWSEADIVYFEVEADAPDAQSQALNIVMTQGFNTQGETLTATLEPDDAQKLREVVSELNLPLAGIDPMRPWNAFLTLSVQFIVNQGFEPGAGVDSVLLAEARALGKELVFFETLQQQLALFTELDPETEENMLVVTLREWDDQQAAFDDLFNAWRSGDVDAIDSQMNKAMREQAPTVHQNIIVDRNIAWAATLDEALKSGAGKAFIAVGAGHLVGAETSVPALLAQKGYAVERIQPSAKENAANDNAPTP